MGFLSKLFNKNTPAPPAPIPEFNVEDLQVKAILEYKEPNDDYRMTKKQMIDYCSEDEPVYQYEIDFWCELVKGSSSIKVVDADDPDVYLGRISDADLEEVGALIDSGQIRAVEGIAEGGKYKVLREEYDKKAKEFIYTIDKGQSDYSLKIKTLLKREEL